MCGCKMADLQGYSVATTSMCTAKLEHSDEIRTRGKCNFENKILEMVFQLLEEIYYINSRILCVCVCNFRDIRNGRP